MFWYFIFWEKITLCFSRLSSFIYFSTFSPSSPHVQAIIGATSSACGSWCPSTNVCDTPHRGAWGLCALSALLWTLLNLLCLEDFFIFGLVPCFPSQMVYSRAVADVVLAWSHYKSFYTLYSHTYSSNTRWQMTTSSLSLLALPFYLQVPLVFVSVTSTVPSSCLANAPLSSLK